MDIVNELAGALGVPVDEAQREYEDSGLARLNSIHRHAICTGCGGFRYEHQAGEGFNETCVFED